MTPEQIDRAVVEEILSHLSTAERQAIRNLAVMYPQDFSHHIVCAPAALQGEKDNMSWIVKISLARPPVREIVWCMGLVLLV